MTQKNENWINPKGYEAFKQIFSIFRIVLILAVLYFAALWILSSPSLKAGGASSSASPVYIPTVRELQEALCAAGYEVEVDCVVGDETK